MVGCFLNGFLHKWVAHENATSKWLKRYAATVKMRILTSYMMLQSVKRKDLTNGFMQVL